MTCKKKRILLVNDFSQLPTGYGLYGRHLLSILSEKYEVAELACYVSAGDPRINNCAWKVYPNKPKDEREKQIYNSMPSGEYGEYLFNKVCLDFKPTHVIDIRDPWAFEFAIRSPFREYFSHVLMPTVDAFPNMPDWLDYYAQSDALLTYSEFGRDSILKQSSNINFIGIASPAPSESLHIKSDEEIALLKKNMQIPDGFKIIGTVMRNQPRKLFADLFEVFSKSHGNYSILYCHTGFPDLGWNIPELLMEYNITNRVMFSYKCSTCNAISARFFTDAVCHCPKCGNFTNHIAGVGHGYTDDELCCVYNCMDGYIQCSKNEGFGIPLVEAAKCGVPIAGVYYSAMESILDNLDGYVIGVDSYEKEASTGRNLARPNHKLLSDCIINFSSTPKHILKEKGYAMAKSCERLYNWGNVREVWFKAIENARPARYTWDSPKRIFHPEPIMQVPTAFEQANFLILRVLGRPDMVGGQLWRRLVKDLTYGARFGSYGEFYFNESSQKDSMKQIPFSYENAYEEICKLRHYFNSWESGR